MKLRHALAEADQLDGGRALTTKEAAERLGIHRNTLCQAARDGRVRGAFRTGASGKLWRFRERELELLPPHTSLTPAGPGRPRRSLEPSATVQAIRDANVRSTRKAA
jgi:excisionase family DNA binding protein